MTASELTDLAMIFAICVAAALAVLWLSGTIMARRTSGRAGGTASAKARNTFLLRDGLLVDHDCSARGTMDEIADWAQLRDWLGGRFPTLPVVLPESLDAPLTCAAADGDTASCILSMRRDTARLVLADPVACDPADRHQSLRLEGAHVEDHAALRYAPTAIWKTDDAGNIVWRNEACGRVLGDQVEKVLQGVEIPDPERDSRSSRVAVSRSGSGEQIWFDVHAHSTDAFKIYYATDVTSTVQAETAQREFVQTLTKTFANLTTGLAIFDRNQQLALFNPALVDLTALPAEFLSGRPNLLSFFDNLRDRQVMPEPKSYADWRGQINEMVKTASVGLYQETWSLPSGVTYRVTGRPHPDGAVAFLFEDITAEISLTRRFRAQNDLRQAVIDKLDHAVAVIAPNNVVIFCNTAWTEMFGVDPDTSFAELGIRDLVAVCRQKFPHPDFWKTVETQTTCKTLSHPIEEVIETDQGDTLRCRLVPVAGGAALICWPQPQPAATPPSGVLAS